MLDSRGSGQSNGAAPAPAPQEDPGPDKVDDLPF